MTRWRARSSWTWCRRRRSAGRAWREHPGSASCRARIRSTPCGRAAGCPSRCRRCSARSSWRSPAGASRSGRSSGRRSRRAPRRPSRPPAAARPSRSRGGRPDPRSGRCPRTPSCSTWRQTCPVVSNSGPGGSGGERRSSPRRPRRRRARDRSRRRREGALLNSVSSRPAAASRRAPSPWPGTTNSTAAGGVMTIAGLSPVSVRWSRDGVRMPAVAGAPGRSVTALQTPARRRGRPRRRGPACPGS